MKVSEKNSKFGKTKSALTSFFKFLFSPFVWLFYKTKGLFIKPEIFKENITPPLEQSYLETLNLIRSTESNNEMIISIPNMIDFFDSKNPLEKGTSNREMTGKMKISRLIKEDCEPQYVELLLFELAIRSGSIIVTSKLFEAGITTKIGEKYDALQEKNVKSYRLEPEMVNLLRNLKRQRDQKQRNTSPYGPKASPKGRGFFRG